MNFPHAFPSPDERSAAGGPAPSDLLWQAFRYVSGDDVQADGSPGAESAQFEARLAVDQGAREAVAQVVTLVAAMKAAPPVAAAVEPAPAPAVNVPAPARLAKWLAPVSWMSVGAAAMWLVGLGLPLRSPVALDQAGAVATQVLEYPAGLAAVLSSLPNVESADDAPLPPSSEPYSELAMLDAYLGDEAGEDDPMGVPAWMLQAVSESRRQTTSQE